MKRLKNRYRYPVILLKQLVKTDFKLRYQGSVLGYAWSLLRPLAMFVILYVVFAKFFRLGDAIPSFPIYLLVGIVLWNYFAEVTSNSINSIVGRGDILRKINFPKYVIVLAGSISALINLFLNCLIIILFMLVAGVEISVSILWVPLLLVELFVLSLALSFFLSALFVRFRDVNYIWEVLIQGAFYLTPILYPLSLVPEKYAKLLMLNPVAQIIQDIRHAVVTPKTMTLHSSYNTWLIYLVPLSIIAGCTLLSIKYFRARSKHFAEEV